MLQKFFTLENKFIFYLLSQRRNFIPILSIYYLTLPDTTANQIGVFTALGYLFSFILEIPSGYISDRVGHRKTLLFSKILQTLSVLLFIVWYFVWPVWNYYCFILAFIFQSVGFSFFSGTTWAYYHELLEEKWEWNLYGKKMWLLKAKASLYSAFIIILLPLTTYFHILWPLIIWAIFDIFWTLAIYFMPKVKQVISSQKAKSLVSLIKESKANRGLYFSIFMGLPIWFFMWEHAYRGIYLEYLWYPLILMWVVMSASRIVWYFVWKYGHNIEKYFTIRQHLYAEMLLFPIALFAIFFFSNPYIVWIIYIFIIWYQHGRKPILENYLLQNYISDNRYKATFLSLESQFSSIFSMAVTLAMWYLVALSFDIWYLSLSASLFFCMIITYFLIFRQRKTQA